MDKTFQKSVVLEDYYYDTELNKQEELKRISKNINELQSVYVDVNKLVSEQSISIDNIETAIKQADTNTEKGTSELLQAKHHKVSYRKKYCICGIIVFFILICIVVVIISIYLGRFH